jgi:isocitrate lyase
MEDAATAEISRTQLWSWIRHGIKLEDGRTITRALVERFITEESRALRAAAPKGSFIGEATDLLRKLVFADRLPDFLTLVAYGRLVTLANEPIVHSTDLNIQAELDSIEQFLHKPRFAHLTRPYTAEDVLRLRGSIVAPHASNFLAQKAWNMFKEFQRTKQYSRTFGCLDPVQVVQMAKYLSTVYVSGWQSSSTASTTNEPGPDFADYPYNTVPNKVDQLFKAQLFHDRKQRNERASMSTEELARTPLVDYLRPIIADGDTGHGGVTAVMKLMKEFIEAGAAGVHFEDQRAGAKKCGHMGGKVLVSTQEHIDRLCAARLQADIMGVETLIVARTDAEAATLIDTDIDPRDQFFILGTTREDLPPLHRMLATSDPRDMDKLTNEWLKDAKLSTFFDAVSAELSSRNDKAKLSEWTSKAKGLGWHDSRDLADRLGLKGFFWCADKARTREGFFRLKCGVDTVRRLFDFGYFIGLFNRL